MAACSFFGDSDCMELRRYQLEEAITDLIVNRGVDQFYVGNEGLFDALVHWVLFSMKKKYPHIRYAVVLARPPKNLPGEDYSGTLLPDGIEAIAPSEAAAWRDRWMLHRADYIVAEDAAKLIKEAGSEGKQIIQLV